MQRFKTKSILTCWHVLQAFQNKPVRKVALTRDSCTPVQLCNTCSTSWENRFPIVHEDTVHFSITLHNCGLLIGVWLQQDSFSLAHCIPRIHTSTGVLAGRDPWFSLVLSPIGAASTGSDQLLLCLAESQELPRTESPWPLWVTCSNAEPASQWRWFSWCSTWTCQAVTCDFCPFLYHLPLLRWVCLRQVSLDWNFAVQHVKHSPSLASSTNLLRVYSVPKAEKLMLIQATGISTD